MNWDGWTDWVALDDASPPPGAGVYAVSCGRKTARVGADDPEGILDIGESSSLRTRLLAFRRCASSAGTRGHMAGWRLRVTGLTARLGSPPLRVRWREYDDRAAAYRGEGDQLGAYLL